MNEVRTAVEQKLKTIQEDNAASLEQMRQTVDEKLQGTLEKRLGESFKLVSERLEQVYKGLGEMQTLAVGVGDLKRVLTNVKARGTWGEVQLGRMLEQVLLPDQYDKNVATKDGGGAGRIRHQAAGPGRRQGRDRLAAHRRQVPHRRLPAAPGCPGKGRCRTGRSRWQATGESDQGVCGRHLRQVPEPAQDHGFRHSVPAHRGAVCRGRSPPWPAGNDCSGNTRWSWPGRPRSGRS